MCGSNSLCTCFASLSLCLGSMECQGPVLSQARTHTHTDTSVSPSHASLTHTHLYVAAVQGEGEAGRGVMLLRAAPVKPKILETNVRACAAGSRCRLSPSP